MLLQKLLVAGLVMLPMVTLGASPAHIQSKPVEMLRDRQEVMNHFRALGYRAHGNVERV